MLCLYNPYNFNRSAAGGRAVPVRGILLTVFKAWTKTRSEQAVVNMGVIQYREDPTGPQTKIS